MSPLTSARSSGRPDAGLVLENARLLAELRASLAELLESRQRILAVADETRQQISRDLHDGAQQRLFLMRLRLSAESERVRAERPELAEMLEELGFELEETIDEVRSLARGIFPAMLAGHGLAESLRWAALEDPVVVSVHTDGVGRYDPEVERAVYFACLEALQNAAKHAGPAHRVWISLVDDGGALRFDVRDDGTGLGKHANGAGSGLVNIRDRIAAVGGEVRIDSAPGQGTTVRGCIPRTAAMVA
jgi:signal transduction histidine kinase